VSSPGESRDASLGALAVLSEEMRWRLYSFVGAAHRPVSREEAAASTGISRKLAAFHLDRLVAAGLLRARYDAPPGRRRVGRTPKTYEPAGVDIAISVPPRDHALLAGILVDAVGGGGPVRDARSAALRAARARGVRAGAGQRDRLRPGRLGMERALSLAGQVLAEAGFEPCRDSPAQLTLRNCPFHPLAGQAPDLVCAINHAYLGGLLEGLGATAVAAVADPQPGACCVRLSGRAAPGS